MIREGVWRKDASKAVNLANLSKLPNRAADFGVSRKGSQNDGDPMNHYPTHHSLAWNKIPGQAKAAASNTRPHLLYVRKFSEHIHQCRVQDINMNFSASFG